MSYGVPVDGSETLYQLRFCSFYHDLHKVLAPSKRWVCLVFLNHQQYQRHFSALSRRFFRPRKKEYLKSLQVENSRVSISVASLDRWKKVKFIPVSWDG